MNAMTGLITPRPHFRHPPILEQAIAVTFERIPEFDIVDFGLFWTELRREFPQADTAPKTTILVEAFEAEPARMEFRLAPVIELPRAMFRNDSGELVQIQIDRFGFNWIKPSENSSYPRYDATRARFIELYGRFTNYLEGRYGFTPDLQQCEITNVNIVPVSDFGTDFSDMDQAFKVDKFDLQIDGVIAETFFRQRQYRIEDPGGIPVGRLHVSLSPVFRVEDGSKAFNFELTARSTPVVQNIDQVLAFFDRAHDIINGAFMATVTSKMCKLWGEYDGQ